MRLASASVLTLALLTASAAALPGCAFSSGLGSAASRPASGPVKASLAELGVEGKTYVNDLGAVSSIHLRDAYVAGNDLLIEDIHGHLTFVDGASLLAKWEYTGLPGTTDCRPAISASAVVAISKGRMFVLSRGAGIEESAPGFVPVVPSAAPVCNDSTLFVPTFRTPSGNKTLEAVSLASGNVGWGWRTSGDVIADAAIAGAVGSEVVYFASDDGMVYAIPASPTSTREVEPAWVANLHTAVEKPLAVDGDHLAIVTERGQLAVLDRITGKSVFDAFAGTGEVATGPAQFGPKHVFYACGGELRAFDRSTGEKSFAVKGATRFIAHRGNRILVAGASGMVHSVDAKTGKVLASKNLAGWHFPTRSAADATVLAVSNRGMLMSVESGW